MVVQADDAISFRQFAKKSGAGDGDDVSVPPFLAGSVTETDRLAEQFEVDISRATGASESRDDFISKLSRIVQLTGESFVAKRHPLLIAILAQASLIPSMPRRSSTSSSSTFSLVSRMSACRNVSVTDQ